LDEGQKGRLGLHEEGAALQKVAPFIQQ